MCVIRMVIPCPSIFTTMTLCFFLLTINLPQSHSQAPLPAPDYSACKESSYNCGNLTGVSYPFWGQNRPAYCGGGDMFNLTCHRDVNTTILIDSQNFTVLGIYPNNHTMALKRTDLDIDLCSPQFNDTHLIPDLFQYIVAGMFNITIFYHCSDPTKKNPLVSGGLSAEALEPQAFFPCGGGEQDDVFSRVYVNDNYMKGLSESYKCTRYVKVPGNFSPQNGAIDRHDLERGLDEGFQVKYEINQKCIDCLGRKEGNCPWGTSDNVDTQFLSSCYYCSNASHCSNSDPSAAPKSKWNWKRKFILGATVAGSSICITTIFCFIRKSSPWCGKFRLASTSDLDIEAFLKNQGALTLQRCKFSYVKKITDSFKVKLGQGGFGVVYKGTLPTGSLVAVKILNSAKGNGQDFINEVASISRTSHVNVVNLLGFCLEGNKKALIYEFMSNGSLDKFIYKKGPENIASLSWKNLYQIAVGIARGLEYLHKGCNTRILHFDIKPHNILLDENFCPKISDFGLAKLCPRKESVISMSDARGTIGYVAPELWNRHFGGVSHKSDVYSYGMMLLEMVGGRHNIHAEASNTSEIYFPHWVYNRLELGSDLELTGVIAEEENAIARRMTLVSLWCIQTIPNDRPPMSKVIDMLEGNMDSLEIPPKPLFSSPTRSLPESSTICN